ncbi:MAG: hypothetical protein HOH89_07335, partial [Alphaproteobacteria bacterium]|nr:hypothetical protein [Alphaproteobacteria bacterium]
AVWPAQTQTPVSPPPDMTFFVTSVGIGDGANLGGLAGADAHCLHLANAVGAGAKPWHAYLSHQLMNGVGQIDARDRIGNGPWHNAVGVEIAANVDALHGDGNHVNAATALTERGEPVDGDNDRTSRHDILTGTKPDGTSYDEDYDKTCGNWTSNSPGEAMVGHHDLVADMTRPNSWNNAHVIGCSQSNLARTGGEGLFYCFAVIEG